MRDSVAKAITSGTSTIYVASETVTINRLSISNVSGSSSTIAVYKLVSGVSISIDAYNATLASGSLNVLNNIVLLKGWGIQVATTQTVHVDLNIL